MVCFFVKKVNQTSIYQAEHGAWVSQLITLFFSNYSPFGEVNNSKMWISGGFLKTPPTGYLDQPGRFIYRALNTSQLSQA